MSKARKGKIIHMLSPENYIRQKARSLPLHECLVNIGWKDSQMVNVIIARKHINGNITACLYLVDLYCQGVKDTTWFFNIPVSEYNDLKEKIDEKLGLEPVKYELAHNIIFSALEFAEDYGFYPHKDFTGITIFMLEEDSDAIELIDIECGVDGKPAYMRSPNHTKRETEMIIAKLEKNPGPGNYVIYDKIDADTVETSLEGEDDDEDENDYEDEYAGMDFNEKKELFLPLLSRLDSLSETEVARFSSLGSALFFDLCDHDLVNRYFDEINDELKIKILPWNEIPDELLGYFPGTLSNSHELKKLFSEIYEVRNEHPGKARKMWKTFRGKAGGLPAVAFLELKLFDPDDDEGYLSKLKIYASRYSDYPMIKLLMLTEMISSVNQNDIMFKRELKSIFHTRVSLHPIELVEYLRFYSFTVSNEKNPHKMEALCSVLKDIDFLPENHLIGLLSIIMFAKIKYVTEYFTRESPV